MNLLTIQSHVAYGHVGNAAAVFALQRLGIEAWPVHTVQFSNHTGYGAWRGQVFDAGLIDEVVEGLSERGVLARCDGVLSGYMGSCATGEAILKACDQVRLANPQMLYCCDPVIGDYGRGIFVRPGIPQFMRERAVPAAFCITPNLFELEYLAGRSIASRGEALAAIHSLQGPRLALITSMQLEETPQDALDMMAIDGTNAYLLRTPKLDLAVNGAGDLIAALFFAHYLKSFCVKTALERAASSTFGILQRTFEARSQEITLIAAQEEIISPSLLFSASTV